MQKKEHKPEATPSRLFIYYNERVIEHSVESDSGALLRDGIKTVNKQGACREKATSSRANASWSRAAGGVGSGAARLSQTVAPAAACTSGSRGGALGAFGALCLRETCGRVRFALGRATWVREIAARLGAEACELEALESEACVGREVSSATRGAVGAGAGSAGAVASDGAAEAPSSTWPVSAVVSAAGAVAPVAPVGPVGPVVPVASAGGGYQ